MLPSSQCRVGVAVSGGADSIFLLTVLKQLTPHLTILHLNHGLRGAESDSDEAFVLAAAARVRLPMVAERAAGLHPGNPNLEELARSARYEFFARAAAQHHLDCVATGHTLDDQAETFLLRLLRGAGGTGLAGIQPVSRGGLIIRPLLDIERCEIEAWLTGRRIPWREDASNRDPVFARNRVRGELLPQLERDWNPGIRRVLSRTAAVLAGEESYWREWTSAELARSVRPFRGTGRGLVLNLAPLASLHSAAMRRLIRAAVEQVRDGSLRRIDYDHVDRVVRLCRSKRGSGSVTLPGLTVRRSFDRLLLALEPSQTPFLAVTVRAPGPVPISGVGTLHFRATPPPVHNGYNTDAGLGPGTIDPPVVVRGWRPGDAYRPVGHSSCQKLKDLFQEHQVPSWERPSWPIIESDGQIVWARRFGLAAGIALNWACDDEFTPE